jgi:hypothetical protein
MSKINVDIAQRWQEFRVRCLELAFKGGATEKNAIEVADRLGFYILTRSDVEIRISAADTGGEA